MIFRGNGCAIICITPIGRQCASGLSLLLSAMRCLTRSAAHGWYGAPPATCAPILPNTPPPGVGAPVVAPGTPVAAGAVVPAAPGAVGVAAEPPAGAAGGGGAASHTPDRSGFPSAVRGAGALTSGFPSAVM